MKVVYDWLKEYVGEDIPSVQKVEELFTFHAFEVDGIEKVGAHDVLDIKILPDRSSDCLSHRGIARELSTLTGTPLLKDPFAQPVVLSPQTEKIAIAIEHQENCRRFGAALVTGVSIQESPKWLQDRLHALGQRSINNVVDATNYVMLALGQPLHAYDAEKLSHTDGVWRLGVRMSRQGEEIETLSKETYILDTETQLIVDASSDTPLGIAGIKGGSYAEIGTGTTTIILEAANFNPQITRRTAQTLKLQTDASKRFENNLSPEHIQYALADVVKLITEIAGGVCEGYVDTYPNPVKNQSVRVMHAQITALLGIIIPTDVVENIFARLGFIYTGTEGVWEVVAPFERTDVLIAEDVIAEVGRVYGYEHVQSVLPTPATLTEYNTRHYYSEKIRSLLVGEGFSEVITSSFAKKDTIELRNPLAKDKGCLRSSLRKNMQEVLDQNIPNVDLLGLTRVQVFEIGTVFNKSPEGKGVVEQVSLAIGVRTKQQGPSAKDTERLTEVLSALKSVLGDTFDAVIADGILECSLTNLLPSLPKPTAYDAYTPLASGAFAPFSPYPFISRDIAVWVPEDTDADAIEELLRKDAGLLLTRMTLFDAFKKDDRVSYAFRLVFQSFDRTLTYEEVSPIMDTLTKTMQAAGYEVR